MSEKEKLVARYLALRGGSLHNVATARVANTGQAYDSDKFRYLSDKYSAMAAERFEEIARNFAKERRPSDGK